MTATATRPDEVILRDTSASFLPAPEGQHQAVAVDVIDLGPRVETFAGKDPREVHKIAIVYQIEELNPESGLRFEIAVEKTASMNPKAGLRKWLEAWRGKAYTDDQARKEGVPVHKLIGVNAFITIEHKVSKQNRTYGLASNIMPKPKAVGAIEAANYQRQPFWTKRREEYAEEVRRFRSMAAASTDGENAPLYEPNEADDDDALPF